MKLIEKTLKKLLNETTDILLQWIYPFAIFKKEDGIPIPALDSKGKPKKNRVGNPVYETNWTATVITRVLSVGTAVYGTTVILDKPVSEWLQTLYTILGW